jgi:hypothetical protein
VADRLPPQEHESARAYLDSLKEAQNEFLLRLADDPDVRKGGIRTLFKTHKERMVLRACGPLPPQSTPRPNKTRAL